MLLLVIRSHSLSATLSFTSPLVTKSQEFLMHLIVTGSRILVKAFHSPVTKKSGAPSATSCDWVGNFWHSFLCSVREFAMAIFVLWSEIIVLIYALRSGILCWRFLCSRQRLLWQRLKDGSS